MEVGDEAVSRCVANQAVEAFVEIGKIVIALFDV